MNKQMDMLRSMYNVLSKQGKDPEETFQLLMDFIASQFEFKIPVHTQWFNPDMLKNLYELFDVNILKEDPWDWFGELHKELNLTLIDNSLVLDREHLAKVAPNVTTGGLLPSRVLDTEAYTGRHIIEMWRKSDNAIFYGVESDITAYQLSLLNMMCYDIPHSILYGNPNDMDIREFSPNWRESNLWIPSTRRIQSDEVDERLRIVDGFYRVV